MFSDFVAECRADLLRRSIGEESELEHVVGMETLAGPRPIAVAA